VRPLWSLIPVPRHKSRLESVQGLPRLFPRYNIAPSQEVPVIVRNDKRNELRRMRWGLVPSWSQDRSVGQRMITSRAETLLDKPSFKQLVSTRRCLVPADGFYEWRREGNCKVPMWPMTNPAPPAKYLRSKICRDGDGDPRKKAKRTW
jgi:putative SOS response-associated peptidase YedK